MKALAAYLMGHQHLAVTSVVLLNDVTPQGSSVTTAKRDPGAWPLIITVTPGARIGYGVGSVPGAKDIDSLWTG